MGNTDTGKSKALELAMAQIEKAYGKEAVMMLGDRAAKIKIDAIPTGVLSLDLALGVGGFPRGRIIEIYGPESSGKTTLALMAVAQAQRLGGLRAARLRHELVDHRVVNQLGARAQFELLQDP